ncbi:bestrophin protein [Ceratobasidium sp. AG-Ba]|nr:bestrophin protein [Ceratobasidium sp. AG-Ba]
MFSPRRSARKESSEDSQATAGRGSPNSTNHFVTGGLSNLSSQLTPSFSALANAFFATALYRAWNLIVLATLWATLITLICAKVHDLSIPPTIITVYGIVVGFTISYRTSSSFERYNEGRKLWSTIVLATRTFSRTVWFHVPDELPKDHPDTNNKPLKQIKAESLIEKLTVIRLIEAFSVAVKHYLRSEDGIEYDDLYYLVNFLPVYALPNSIHQHPGDSTESFQKTDSPIAQRAPQTRLSYELPQPVTSKEKRGTIKLNTRLGASNHRSGTQFTTIDGPHGPIKLARASNPPEWSIYDIWPISLLVKPLLNKGINVGGKIAAKAQAKEPISHNVPLEISFYLSSYIAGLQRKKGLIDVPTTNLLFASLNQLVDSLSGLERILSSPIPFSYGIHLWSACALYIALMVSLVAFDRWQQLISVKPFQIWSAFGYVTIPATGLAAFFFFGFLAAGEEIENPFGYDKNDLDLDSFCREIVHKELEALISRPPSIPEDWVFAATNNRIFKQEVAPTQWVSMGTDRIREQLKQDVHDE